MRGLMLGLMVALTGCTAGGGYHRECLVQVGCRCHEYELVRDVWSAPIPDGIPLRKVTTANGWRYELGGR